MNVKLKMLMGLFSVFCFGNVFAEEAKLFSGMEKAKKEEHCFRDCDDYDNILRLKLLCAKCIRARCIEAEQIDVENLNAVNFCTGNVSTQAVCTNTLGVNTSACISALTSNNIQTTDLCVAGQASFNEVCGRYRAVVDLSSDTTYTLGTDIPFNLIVDDPNGNVTLSPFAYTAPVTGYYIINSPYAGAQLVFSDCDDNARVSLKVSIIDTLSPAR